MLAAGTALSRWSLCGGGVICHAWLRPSVGAQDMRRLHGGAEPWARFHREYNKNDDIEVKPWEPEVWTAESNWQCRREITSSKPINIPAWLCRLLGAPLRPPGTPPLRVYLALGSRPCVPLIGNCLLL